MNFPNNHSVNSQIATFISKVLEHQEWLLTFPQYYVKTLYFLLIGHI